MGPGGDRKYPSSFSAGDAKREESGPPGTSLGGREPELTRFGAAHPIAAESAVITPRLRWRR